MTSLIMVLGVALILVLLYLVLTNQPIPPAFKMVALVGIGLLLLLCLAQHAGCAPPFEIARPRS